MVERGGDRQRKFDGLEKWPFRTFIDSLPIMLQIALLLLASALSRYVWSTNTSVARVIISFTVLGFLFFVGIVVAGTSSYECPFQTPASTGLRYLRESATTRKTLATLSPPNLIRASRRNTRRLAEILSPPNLIRASWRNTRRLAEILSLPSATSLIYAAQMDVLRGFISVLHRVYDMMRYPFSGEISLSRIISGIHNTATKVGRRTIILLRRIDRAFGNAKQRLVKGIWRFWRAGLLPTTVEDGHFDPVGPQKNPGLRVSVRDLERVQGRNADNARCVCWVLRNITDPEVIDSAICLAGTIRWFDGDSDSNPPFGLIVSTFKACFDSTGRLYPGMKDRAYFSARAILQINANSRTHSLEHPSKYSIPDVSRSRFQCIDPDLYDFISMLRLNSRPGEPTPNFPRAGTSTHVHSQWISNLFVELIRPGLDLRFMQPYQSYLSAAMTNDQAVVANTLVMWYMFLGGHVEEETFWAFDKSYAAVS